MATALTASNNIEKHFEQNHKYIPPKVGDKVRFNPKLKSNKEPSWLKGKTYFFVHAVIYKPYSNIFGTWKIDLMWDTSNIYTIEVSSKTGSTYAEGKFSSLKVLKTYNKKYGWSNVPPEFYKIHNIKVEEFKNISFTFDNTLYNDLTKEKAEEIINNLANINDPNLEDKIKIYIDGKQSKFNIKKKLFINLD